MYLVIQNFVINFFKFGYCGYNDGNFHFGHGSILSRYELSITELKQTYIFQLEISFRLVDYIYLIQITGKFVDSQARLHK